MGRVSKELRNTEDGYAHWCPGCNEMHLLHKSWTFNGNIDSPTFSPSFLIRGLKRVFLEGQWTGEWQLDVNGKPIPFICHYILTDGILHFCGDSTHALAGKSIPLPELPF